MQFFFENFQRAITIFIFKMDPLVRVDADLEAVCSSLGYTDDEGNYIKEPDCLGCLENDYQTIGLSLPKFFFYSLSIKKLIQSIKTCL